MNKVYATLLDSRLDEIIKKQVLVRAQLDVLYTEQMVLDREKSDILPLILLEKGLLREAPWVVKEYNSKIYLYGQTEADRPLLTEFFTKSSNTDYHTSVRLGDGYEVRNDDRKYSIWPVLGEDDSDFTTFVKRWNIVVDTTEIERIVGELNQGVATFVSVLETFK